MQAWWRRRKIWHAVNQEVVSSNPKRGHNEPYTMQSCVSNVYAKSTVCIVTTHFCFYMCSVPKPRFFYVIHMILQVKSWFSGREFNRQVMGGEIPTQ